MSTLPPAASLFRDKSTTPSSVTGTTGQTALAVSTIPPGLLKAGSRIRARALFLSNGSANNKTPQILLNEANSGTTSADIFYNAGTNGWSAQLAETLICVGQDLRQQFGGLYNAVGGLSGGLVRCTHNAAVGLDVVFAAQLSTSTDYVTLAYYEVEVIQ